LAAGFAVVGHGTPVGPGVQAVAGARAGGGSRDVGGFSTVGRGLQAWLDTSRLLDIYIYYSKINRECPRREAPFMQLSNTVEYALRAVVWLAGRPGEAHTSQEIAAATQTPGRYLSKVLGSLSRAGVVSAQRGMGGGFTLARPAATLTVLEVVNAVEPVQRVGHGRLNLPEHAHDRSGLHRLFDDALDAVEETLSARTIADLLADAPSPR
jgi:Rrf2 family transcriptional regulator, nitric oxide-sensitive transcriptional repressor